ncbi:hypothetical protein ACHAXR_006133 [Thalassiosira sp. AJA248-18]
MKLSLAILSAALGLASAKKHSKNITPKSSIKATSNVGQKVMSKARRLDENEEIDYTWVANMSLKFQGCYHTQQWNEEANDEEDVRISTQRLVRFRLCPSDTCSMENAAGCNGGYGDYIIGMEEYLEAYFEAIEQDQEYNCEYEKEYGDCANCGNADDEEICEYDCYMAKGMEYCVDNNPYNDDEEEEEEEWELKDMAECREYNFENNNNRKNKKQRKLDEDEVEYFVGAYCSENGGNIYLGLFTEDTCSQFADDYGGRETFAALSYGKSLPYSESTMIGTECMSCKEPADADQNNDNDNQDADEVKESCEQLYEAAGKCEAGLSDSGTVAYPNNYACNFMQGIKIVRKNGSIVRGAGAQNTTASVFIGLFACSFVLMGGYVYYLKTKLDRGKINLSE